MTQQIETDATKKWLASSNATTATDRPPSSLFGQSFYVVWRAKFWIVFATVLSVIAATIYLRSATRHYTAVVALTGAESSPPSRGLASLGLSRLGISDGQSAIPPYDRFFENLTSIRLSEALQERYQLLQVFHHTSWNEETKQWHPPSGLMPATIRSIRSFFKQPEWTPPDGKDLVKFIEQSVQVRTTKQIGVKEIVFSWPDPVFAENFLTKIINESDRLLREEEQRKLEFQSTGLWEALDATSVMEYKSIIYELISDVERKKVVLQSRPYYSVEIVRPVVVSAQPTHPKLRSTFGVALVAGLVGGLLLDWLARLIQTRPRFG